jgi:hypothetical protein
MFSCDDELCCEAIPFSGLYCDEFDGCAAALGMERTTELGKPCPSGTCLEVGQAVQRFFSYTFCNIVSSRAYTLHLTTIMQLSKREKPKADCCVDAAPRDDCSDLYVVCAPGGVFKLRFRLVDGRYMARNGVKLFVVLRSAHTRIQILPLSF